MKKHILLTIVSLALFLLAFSQEESEKPCELEALIDLCVPLKPTDQTVNINSFSLLKMNVEYSYSDPDTMIKRYMINGLFGYGWPLTFNVGAAYPIGTRTLWWAPRIGIIVGSAHYGPTFGSITNLQNEHVRFWSQNEYLWGNKNQHAVLSLTELTYEFTTKKKNLVVEVGAESEFKLILGTNPDADSFTGETENEWTLSPLIRFKIKKYLVGAGYEIPPLKTSEGVRNNSFIKITMGCVW